jgi:trigger factor
MAATAEDCKRAVDISIPAEEVEQEMARVAREIQKRARIPGFRPGKAPLSLVKQRFQTNIRDEVLQNIVPGYLRSTVERENLQAVANPAISDLQFREGEPLRFKATFEVMPEFELGDYKAIRVAAPEIGVTPEEVDAEIESLRLRRSTLEDIPAEETEGKLADGQIAVANFERTIAGEPAGETTTRENSLFELGAQDLLPGISDALRGATVGSDLEFDIAYPGDYPAKELAGATAHFKFHITGRKRRILPELNEEFAKFFGAESLDDLRARIERELLHEKQHRAEDETQNQIVEQLLELHSFPVPESLIDDQIKTRIERGLRSLEMRGMDVSKTQFDWKRLIETEREPATRDVRVSILLHRIAEQEKIAAEEAEVAGEVGTMAKRFGQPEEALRKRLAEKGGLDQIRDRILTAKTMRFLYQTATGKEPMAPHAERGAE